MTKFSKFAAAASTPAAKTTVVSLPKTIAFLEALDEEGVRLSYAALAETVVLFEEMAPSRLSPGQRGGQIVKKLPTNLHHVVCRTDGTYHQRVLLSLINPPEDLMTRPVIQAGNPIAGAVTAFLNEGEGKEAEEEHLS